MKYTVLYNNTITGKDYKSKREALKEVGRLLKMGLYGYTVSKI